MEDRGAGWAPRAGRSGSVAGTEGGSGVLRVGGKGVWQGVERACGGCLPGWAGEVEMGRGQLWGSVQKREREREAQTGSDWSVGFGFHFSKTL